MYLGSTLLAASNTLLYSLKSMLQSLHLPNNSLQWSSFTLPKIFQLINEIQANHRESYAINISFI